MRLDSHQHFWQYDPAQHVWMTDDMAVLRHDFLPNDLAPKLKTAGFEGTVAVQARQMPEETEWLLGLSDQFGFIKAVVGWVDLCAVDVRDQLRRYVGHPKFKGVRHIVEDEPDVAFMLRSEFRRGIGALAEFGLTYDLLLRPSHLSAATQLVREFPEQPFVVDHIAKPLIREGVVSPWREDIERLAEADNVYCKLSGMVTMARHARKLDDLVPYLDIAFAAFGEDRLMVGSDWPVCTLAGEYGTVMEMVINYVRQFRPEVREKILGGNCASFYHV